MVGLRLVAFATKVGPEFLGYIAECIEKSVSAQNAKHIAEGALSFGTVGVGDARGDGVAGALYC